MEDHRTQRVSAVGVVESVRQWRADAEHIRNLAAQRHLQAEQRAVLLWIGRELGEIAQAEQLAGPLAPYAELTPELIERLRADREADADRGPSVLQRTARSIFGRRL